MPRALLTLALTLALGGLLASVGLAGPAPAQRPTEIAMVQLDGKPLDKATISGKAVLFVNVASKCGYTKQYAGLQKLHEAWKDKGLQIIGVPCNQFGGQEPGTAEEIQNFCQINYGVNFPLLEKQEVNGPGRSPLYRSLVDSPTGGGQDIKWNFEKFLVGKDGAVLARFPSAVTPEDPQLLSAIEAAVAAK